MEEEIEQEEIEQEADDYDVNWLGTADDLEFYL